MRRKKSNNFVFDSYAVFSFLKKEKSSERVKKILKQANKGEITIYLSLVTLGEIYYLLIRELGEKEASILLTKIEELGFKIINVDSNLTKEAAKIKAKGGLSYSDSFVIATALSVGGIIITGDEEFKKFSNIVKIIWL